LNVFLELVWLAILIPSLTDEVTAPFFLRNCEKKMAFLISDELLGFVMQV